jgi:peptidyl-prolyl cis-trans isomerase B (cyclophilin B)
VIEPCGYAITAPISHPTPGHAPQSSEQDAKMVTFHTNHGDIVIKTFDDKAPETVKNFLDYCREGFYNNTIFHRVINGL